jgi:hypothetical protein
MRGQWDCDSSCVAQLNAALADRYTVERELGPVPGAIGDERLRR